MKQVDLSGLRDIHIPMKPDWWPLAIGWWIVLMSVVFVLLVAIWGYIKWRQTPKQYALRELNSLKHQNLEPVLMARRLSSLFKRIVLIQYGSEQAASLSGEKWASFLKTETNGSFSDEQAKLLAFSIYLPDNTLTPAEDHSLYVAARKGIIEIFKRKHNGN